VVWLLKNCKECGRYTLEKEKCPYCGGQVHSAHPPKFSPDDKYLKYRLALKRDLTYEGNND